MPNTEVVSVEIERGSMVYNNAPRCWCASLVQGQVVKGQEIDYGTAKIRVGFGLDVMCSDAHSAFLLAFSPYGMIYEIDSRQSPSKQHYYHFHLYGRHGMPHIRHEGPPDPVMLALYGKKG